MYSTNGPAGSTNGPSGDEDTFERDLTEMLRDGPTLDDLSSTVQTGNTNPASVDLGLGGRPRSYQPPTYLRTGNTSTARSYSATSPHNLTTTDIPLSNPGGSHISPSHSACMSSLNSGRSAGNVTSPVQVKLESFKDWSISTFKCTKQMIAEKLGKGTRTVDLELESQIEALRDTQRKYANILRLARALTSHFQHVVATQRQLGDAFGELAQKSPELQDEFTYNSETQRILSKNGETLLGALNFFTSCVNTLCHKTMEDTILTIKNYETARLEFDAYKADYDALRAMPSDSATVAKLHVAQRKFEDHKAKFEKLRDDVGVKLKFLDENKVKVMHKQLLLFHNAVAAYFSGNQTALDQTLKQFSIKLKPPNTEQPSWLEK